MDGRIAVYNTMKYQIFRSKLLKALSFNSCFLSLFFFCIFTDISIGCLLEIWSIKLIEFSDSVFIWTFLITQNSPMKKSLRLYSSFSQIQSVAL